jgi:hypothetical protein
MVCPFSRDLPVRSFTRRHIIFLGTYVVVVVDVVEVVIPKGRHEASKSSLIYARQRTSPSGVVNPPVCSPSPSWLVLVTESSVVW